MNLKDILIKDLIKQKEKEKKDCKKNSHLESLRLQKK